MSRSDEWMDEGKHMHQTIKKSSIVRLLFCWIVMKLPPTRLRFVFGKLYRSHFSCYQNIPSDVYRWDWQTHLLPIQATNSYRIHLIAISNWLWKEWKKWSLSLCIGTLSREVKSIKKQLCQARLESYSKQRTKMAYGKLIWHQTVNCAK